MQFLLGILSSVGMLLLWLFITVMSWVNEELELYESELQYRKKQRIKFKKAILKARLEASLNGKGGVQ